MSRQVKGFQEVFTSALPEEASLRVLLKFASIILLCKKVTSMFVSSPHFVSYTLYYIVQVDP